MFDELEKQLEAKFSAIGKIIHDFAAEMEILRDEFSLVKKDLWGTPKVGVWLNKKEYPEAKSISRAHESDAGWDICTVETGVLEPGERRIIHTGVHFDLPENWEAQIRPRSGLAAKHGITIVNSPGTIDSSYSGEIMIILHNIGSDPFKYSAGERIAQVVFKTIPRIQIEGLTHKPIDKDRGDAGFGSTGMLEKSDHLMTDEEFEKKMQTQEARMLQAMKELSESHGFELPDDIKKDIANLRPPTEHS